MVCHKTGDKVSAGNVAWMTGEMNCAVIVENDIGRLDLCAVEKNWSWIGRIHGECLNRTEN